MTLLVICALAALKSNIVFFLLNWMLVINLRKDLLEMHKLITYGWKPVKRGPPVLSLLYSPFSHIV